MSIDVVSKNHLYYLVQLCLIAFCYWLAAQLGLFLTPPDQLIPLIWPSSGVSLALLLILGTRLWPSVLVGALIVAFTSTNNTLVGLSLALGNTIEIFTISYLLRYFVPLDIRLSKARDLAALVLIAVGVGGLFSATVATLTFVAGNVVSSTSWLNTLLHCWMADSLGYLLFTPLILCLYAYRHQPLNHNDQPIQQPAFQQVSANNRATVFISVEFVVLVLLALLASYLAFLSHYPSIILNAVIFNSAVLNAAVFNIVGLYLVFPCIMWAAYRFHQRGSVITAFIIGMAAVISESQQLGFFANRNIVMADEYWFFIVTLSCSGLALAAINMAKLGAEKVVVEMIESVNAIIWRATPDFNFTFVSKEAVQILGYPLTEWTQNNNFWIDHLHHEDRLWVPSFCREEASSSESFIVDYRMISMDGNVVWLQNNIKVKRSPQGKVIDFLGVMVDITERKRSELSLNLYKQACERLEEGLVITDADFLVVEANRGHTRITGFPRREVIGFVSLVIQAALHEKQRDKNVLEVLKKTGRWSGEVWCRRKNGETYPNWVSITTIRGKFDVIQHYIAVFSDISDRKKSETNLQFLATHDVLTRLPNRTLLRERLDFSLLRAERNKNKIAIFFVDLDRFKNINDTLGHHIGDELLQAVAKRLKSCFRMSDTVARQGGDEFVILIDEFVDTNYLMTLAEKILIMLQQPYALDLHELHVTASVGISIYPDDGLDGTLLLKHADVAMYRAKSNGKNMYSFYSAETNTLDSTRLALENGLRRAVSRQQLVLHYQPKYDLVLGRIVGAEALLRWQHPDLGLLSPNDFIVIAEETGLIVEIGNWVIEEACKQGMLWQTLVGWPLKVGINLSARQFIDGDLLKTIDSALVSTGLSASCLDLEITESLIMQNPEDATKVLQHFRDLGAQVSIDDFGTGYSSLGYLKHLPIDTLKIDRSFVKDIPADADDMAITQAVISLAHNMQVTVVAEGVETEAQWDFLKHYGCDQIQGYFYSKPLTNDDFVAFLSAETTRH